MAIHSAAKRPMLCQSGVAVPDITQCRCVFFNKQEKMDPTGPQSVSCKFVGGNKDGHELKNARPFRTFNFVRSRE